MSAMKIGWSPALHAMAQARRVKGSPESDAQDAMEQEN
jgi:hypothetical protein